MNNVTLVQYLKDHKTIISKNVERAFLNVDRKDFVGISNKFDAYINSALPIGFGQTISQPSTVAFMLELLEVETGASVLDVGCGSGYTTALLSELVGENGTVLAIDIIMPLIEFAKKNLARYQYTQASVRYNSPTSFFIEEAPFDRILVSASARALPQQYIDQLKINGIMVIPVKEDVVKVTKISKEKILINKYSGFSFVPLITAD